MSDRTCIIYLSPPLPLHSFSHTIHGRACVNIRSDRMTTAFNPPSRRAPCSVLFLSGRVVLHPHTLRMESNPAAPTAIAKPRHAGPAYVGASIPHADTMVLRQLAAAPLTLEHPQLYVLPPPAPQHPSMPHTPTPPAPYSPHSRFSASFVPLTPAPSHTTLTWSWLFGTGRPRRMGMSCCALGWSEDPCGLCKAMPQHLGYINRM